MSRRVLGCVTEVCHWGTVGRRRRAGQWGRRRWSGRRHPGAGGGASTTGGGISCRRHGYGDDGRRLSPCARLHGVGVGEGEAPATPAMPTPTNAHDVAVARRNPRRGESMPRCWQPILRPSKISRGTLVGWPMARQRHLADRRGRPRAERDARRTVHRRGIRASTSPTTASRDCTAASPDATTP